MKKHIWNSLVDTFKTHFTIESHEKKLNLKNNNNSHPYLEIIYSYSKHTVTVLLIKDMLYFRQVWVYFRRLIYIVNTKSYVLF